MPLSLSLILSLSLSPFIAAHTFHIAFSSPYFLNGPSYCLLQTESDDTPAPIAIDEDSLLPPASMDELDDYLDMLYQVRG